MAIKYKNMDGKEFLEKLGRFEIELQRIRLPYGTRLFELPEFEETMERLRGNVGYTPDLERLRAPGLIAPILYLPPQSILSDADLSVTDLSDADLSGTNLRGAYLRGAHIELAIGLTQKQLDSCISR